MKTTVLSVQVQVEKGIFDGDKLTKRQVLRKNVFRADIPDDTAEWLNGLEGDPQPRGPQVPGR